MKIKRKKRKKKRTMMKSSTLNLTRITLQLVSNLVFPGLTRVTIAYRQCHSRKRESSSWAMTTTMKMEE